MPKVFISPDFPNPDKGDGGIRRVVSAMRQYLPQFGWQVVGSPEEADLLNCHAMMRENDPTKPLVYSSHGLHWADYQWNNELLKCNQFMVDTMAMSQAITVPSNWVGMAISRGMLRYPKTIYHGVDINEWSVTNDHKGYVLWNKARHDVVSNSHDMQQLAARMRDVQFVSTIGEKTNNVNIVGVIPYENMKRAISYAGVYLATARETFGIGTLEAMAAGIPIAGWDFGGQREIIIQGETGYLAPYGDYKALEECVRQCLDERNRLSANARQDVIERWQWQDKIGQYAKLFDETLAEWHKPRPKVSIIVTTHNLGHYLTDCLDSVREQSTSDYECLIVDDASTDNTKEVLDTYLATYPEFTQAKYLPTPRNLKLSGARNYGFRHSNGRYILPLDADDKLKQNALTLLSTALDNDKAIHIAYGHLELISEKVKLPDGRYERQHNEVRREHWPFPSFDWLGQMTHINQLPYCSMMRRGVLGNSGGYRIRDWRAEDANFWTRVTSLGYRAAKVTQDTIFQYCIRSDSKGMLEQKSGQGDGDWTAWYPWRVGAINGKIGGELYTKGAKPSYSLVPMGAQGKSPRYCWPVWSFHDPVVSVIIPVGPNHRDIVIDAMDSVQAQTYPFWELIIVNDSGRPLDYVPPFAKAIDTSVRGVANARNIGIKASSAPLVFFLDADDILSFSALEDMLREYVKLEGGRYIYSDWFTVEANGEVKATPSTDYRREANGGGLSVRGISHPISCLIPREWAIATGGFDPSAKGYEDWDFFTRMAINGFCGQRIQKPLLYYRVFTGQERLKGENFRQEIMTELDRRYEAYINGSKQLTMCCGGSLSIEEQRKLAAIKGTLDTLEPNNQIRDYLTMNEINTKEEFVRMEWTGQNSGAITLSQVRGKKLSRDYRPTKLPIGDHWINAPIVDVALLLEHGGYQIVKRQDEGIDFQPATLATNEDNLPVMENKPDFAIQPPTPSNGTNNELQEWLNDKPSSDIIVINTQDGISSQEASQAGQVLSNYKSESNTEILKKSIAEIEKILPDMSEPALVSLRASEVKSKNRKSLLAMIDVVLYSMNETV